MFFHFEAFKFILDTQHQPTHHNTFSLITAHHHTPHHSTGAGSDAVCTGPSTGCLCLLLLLPLLRRRSAADWQHLQLPAALHALPAAAAVWRRGGVGR